MYHISTIAIHIAIRNRSSAEFPPENSKTRDKIGRLIDLFPLAQLLRFGWPEHCSKEHKRITAFFSDTSHPRGTEIFEIIRWRWVSLEIIWAKSMTTYNPKHILYMYIHTYDIGRLLVPAPKASEALPQPRMVLGSKKKPCRVRSSISDAKMKILKLVVTTSDSDFTKPRWSRYLNTP